MKLTDEPTMDTIDDYENKETPEKRKNIHLIMLGLVVFAVFLGVLRMANNTVSDYIGTEQSPGIDVGRR